MIYCTGYKISFPFFDPELIAAPDNEIPLYRRVVSPEHPGLYFIGLLQPLGAIMPLAEAQSEWIADVLEARVELPSTEAMHREIVRDRAAMAKRYVASKRHTIQVDFEPVHALDPPRAAAQRLAAAARPAPARTRAGDVLTGAVAARLPPAWGLRGAPGPAIRRGFAVAAPVGVGLLADLEVRTEVAAGLATAALICGFIAFDAPARVRVRWQLMTAPVVGLTAAIGVLSSAGTVAAVVAMGLVAGISGYLVSVSLRLAIVGLTCTLAVIIAQGFFLDPSDAPLAFVYGTCGGLAQAATAASRLADLRPRA